MEYRINEKIVRTKCLSEASFEVLFSNVSQYSPDCVLSDEYIYFNLTTPY